MLGIERQLVTSNGDIIDSIKVLDAGCEAIINKPIDADELLETLHNLLNLKTTINN